MKMKITLLHYSSYMSDIRSIDCLTASSGGIASLHRIRTRPGFCGDGGKDNETAAAVTTLMMKMKMMKKEKEEEEEESMTGEAGMGLWRITKREQTHFDAVLWEKLAAVAQVRMVALLVHHHACDSCGHSNEAHDGIEPLQADRVDDEATAETHKDANNYSCENLEGLQLGVDMFVQLHLLHGHSINRDIVPHNAIHAGSQQ